MLDWQRRILFGRKSLTVKKRKHFRNSKIIREIILIQLLIVKLINIMRINKRNQYLHNAINKYIFNKKNKKIIIVKEN